MGVVTLPLGALVGLGRYRVGKEINRGGTAVVYEGVDLSLNMPVALKVRAFASYIQNAVDNGGGEDETTRCNTTARARLFCPHHRRFRRRMLCARATLSPSSSLLRNLRDILLRHTLFLFPSISSSSSSSPPPPCAPRRR